MEILPKSHQSGTIKTTYGQFLIGYEISFGESKLIKVDATHGQHCFMNRDQILLTVDRYYDTSNERNFNLAINSQEYLELLAFSQNFDIIYDGEICLIWGSWIPKRIEESGRQHHVPERDNEIQIYFNIITTQSLIQNGYLFYFYSTVGIKNCEVFLVLDAIDSKVKPNPLKEKIKKTFSMTLEERTCKRSIAEEKEDSVSYYKYPHKGTGVFAIYHVAGESESPKVEESIKVFLNTPVEKRGSLTNKAPEILKCTNSGFEFTRDYQYVPKADLRALI